MIKINAKYTPSAQEYVKGSGLEVDIVVFQIKQRINNYYGKKGKLFSSQSYFSNGGI
jgi:hypothetical protein